MAYRVIRGFKADETDTEVCIYTLDGEKIFVLKNQIEKQFENEAGKAGEPGLSTFFINSDATIKLEVRMNDPVQTPGPGTMTGNGWDTGFKRYDDGGSIPKSYDDIAQGPGPSTVYKYLDDGGTISKSRDDGF